MFNTVKRLSMTTALVAAMAVSGAALADDHMGANADTMIKVDESNDATVTATSTTKTVTTAPAPTSIMMYDLNGDGMLSRSEIGNKLFYQFDRDGNESLDNIEWNKSLEIEMAPVETITVTKMDVDGDGVDEEEVVDVDVMMQATGLERFDTDGDGLSPREFTGKSVLELDADDSGLIEMKEWKKAYMNMDVPTSANNEIYNDGE